MSKSKDVNNADQAEPESEDRAECKAIQVGDILTVAIGNMPHRVHVAVVHSDLCYDNMPHSSRLILVELINGQYCLSEQYWETPESAQMFDHISELAIYLWKRARPIDLSVLRTLGLISLHTAGSIDDSSGNAVKTTRHPIMPNSESDTNRSIDDSEINAWRQECITRISEHPAMRPGANPVTVPDFERWNWRGMYARGLTVDQVYANADEQFNSCGW